ncbi:lipopolysaccharide-induced tumor necrosis factor-alpha factor homolog [Bombina bombina]|uniref:lipopolysaccharide-induced tumor necrosis factor-alpha factor homolog n=1 Tax=Bombina bombina TaxID=8345 RepID=UPI00235AFE7B|nr:lipopolysaccharide-induced tumor necrosis factor-alpha factor homolog [Bombina bombina]
MYGEKDQGMGAPPQQPGVGASYMAPPPYGMNPQPAVIVAPVHSTVVIGTSFQDTPVSCSCPICRQNIVTRTEYNTGLLAWLIFGILCLLGCWLGCCLIPFCVDSCKDVDHFCPNCNHHLHKYKRL